MHQLSASFQSDCQTLKGKRESLVTTSKAHFYSQLTTAHESEMMDHIQKA